VSRDNTYFAVDKSRTAARGLGELILAANSPLPFVIIIIIIIMIMLITYNYE